MALAGLLESQRVNAVLSDYEQFVLGHLDGEWRNLREVAERCGYTLSGSGWQNACDRLVDEGEAERQRRDGAPMGFVYRRKL